MSVQRYTANSSGASQISTQQHSLYYFKYGYFEIRAKLSSGFGSTCAFWLQSNTVNNVSHPANTSVNGAEIDIFENGATQGINKLFYSLHWNGYESTTSEFTTYKDSIPGVYSGYHIFGLEWTPRYYAIYVDGVQRFTFDSLISRTPEFIILSNGTGGFGGNETPYPNPDTFKVDYVKVFNRKKEVTLYQNELGNSGKVSAGLQPGSYTTVQLVSLNVSDNSVSSLEVPTGWHATLYDGDNFTGDSLVIGQDTQKLPTFNDRTSSVRIRSN